MHKVLVWMLLEEKFYQSLAEFSAEVDNRSSGGGTLLQSHSIGHTHEVLI